MRRIKFFILMLPTVILSQRAVSQEYVKASITGANTEFRLARNLPYPGKMLNAGISGDVLVSVAVTSEGKLDSLEIIKTPSPEFSSVVLESLKEKSTGWSPATVNGKPLSWKYVIVYRFRISESLQVPDVKKNIVKLLKKGKADKALQEADSAIKESESEGALYRLRGEAKKMLGDIKGSEKDMIAADILNRQILAVVNIEAAYGIMIRSYTQTNVYKLQNSNK